MNKGNIKRIGIGIGVIALIALAACSLTGCGGGGSSDHANNGTVVAPGDPGDGGSTDDPSQVLAGEDTNGNGVWDYAGSYIDTTYPESERARAALREYAKAVQKQLLESEDRNKSREENVKLGSYAVACVKYAQGRSEGIRSTDSLLAEMLNTDPRSKAYFRYNDHLDNSSNFAQVAEAASCLELGLNIDALPN